MSKILLTKDQAKLALPEGDNIHVFKNPGPSILIGASWNRADIIDLIETADTLEVGGQQCLGMKHGLVAFKNGGTYFIESLNEILEQYGKESAQN